MIERYASMCCTFSLTIGVLYTVHADIPFDHLGRETKSNINFDLIKARFARHFLKKMRLKVFIKY